MNPGLFPSSLNYRELLPVEPGVLLAISSETAVDLVLSVDLVLLPSCFSLLGHISPALRQNLFLWKTLTSKMLISISCAFLRGSH